jgi:hypothetical protein
MVLEVKYGQIGFQLLPIPPEKQGQLKNTTMVCFAGKIWESTNGHWNKTIP